MAKLTKAQKKIGTVMREYKEGTLHSGKKGPVVKSRKQAVAIALSEAGRRRYADGGVVDVAAPPVGMTSLTSQPLAQAPSQGPYMSPSDYGVESNTSIQGLPQQPTQVLNTRNRMTGAIGALGGPVQGYSKGGMVKKPRGCGKAVKGLTKGKMY